ncbi:type IIL restriction-modification enzyme MmeI, partial [Enterococcus lactis]
NIAIGTPVKPILNGVPPLLFGNKPTDGGHLFLDLREKDELIAREPKAARWIKKILGANEFINGLDRWCLWLVDATTDEL